MVKWKAYLMLLSPIPIKCSIFLSFFFFSERYTLQCVLPSLVRLRENMTRKNHPQNLLSHHPNPSNKINVEDKKPTTGLDNAEAKIYEEFCVL